jgi:hypothetical protein
MTERARYGWESDFRRFEGTPVIEIRSALHGFVHDASPEQIRAWDTSIPALQREVREVIHADSAAVSSSAILEYELPMEMRRPDVIFLVGGAVAVIELKGKLAPTQADIDQAAAYARDLRCYHRACADHEVLPILVPTRARGDLGFRGGVHVAGPDAVDALVTRLGTSQRGSRISADEFLAEEAYRPLPTLVQAARELFQSGEVRSVWRARAVTDPAVNCISSIIHEAARARTRHLVLITGVPGAGKTLVGLRAVHAHFLDDLAVAREHGKPTAPAVFLSGNGPLVEVLQHELRAAGGGGKTFVRGVKEYVRQYSARPGLVPPQHVLVFDEAQRAFDADQVAARHKHTPGSGGGRSEPEHFVEFADRIPEWCVVIGLIGRGQEIHVGEEGGLIQWRHAIDGSKRREEWTVHHPPSVENVFDGLPVPVRSRSELSLDTEIRFHLAKNVHDHVERLLSGCDSSQNAASAAGLEADGFHLRLTRELDVAKRYLCDRYAEQPEARFGLLASSKDRDLERFGVPNDFPSTRRVAYGPWYGDREDAPGGRSCRRLEACVTEFGAQGLELDAVLLAWGTDFKRDGGRWSNAGARGYRRGAHVRDPFQLRVNAYRVLLTRGRDVCVVFLPMLPELDETFDYLARSGFTRIEDGG